MKTLFASLLIAFTLGTSSLSFASSYSSSSVKDVTPLEARVVVKPQSLKLDVIVGATKQNVIIHLRSAQGQMLAKKQVGKNEQATLIRFDLAQLTDGVYFVEISNGTSKQVEELELHTNAPVPASHRTISLQ